MMSYIVYVACRFLHCHSSYVFYFWEKTETNLTSNDSIQREFCSETQFETQFINLTFLTLFATLNELIKAAIFFVQQQRSMQNDTLEKRVALNEHFLLITNGYVYFTKRDKM